MRLWTWIVKTSLAVKIALGTVLLGIPVGIGLVVVAQGVVADDLQGDWYSLTVGYVPVDDSPPKPELPTLEKLRTWRYNRLAFFKVTSDQLILAPYEIDGPRLIIDVADCRTIPNPDDGPDLASYRIILQSGTVYDAAVVKHEIGTLVCLVQMKVVYDPKTDSEYLEPSGDLARYYYIDKGKASEGLLPRED